MIYINTYKNKRKVMHSNIKPNEKVRLEFSVSRKSIVFDIQYIIV